MIFFKSNNLVSFVHILECFIVNQSMGFRYQNNITPPSGQLRDHFVERTSTNSSTHSRDTTKQYCDLQVFR